MCSVKCRRGDHAVQPRVHARATRHGQPDAAARWRPLEGRARLPSHSTLLSIPSRARLRHRENESRRRLHFRRELRRAPARSPPRLASPHLAH